MNALALMYVTVGGAFGSMCRYVVQFLCTRYIGLASDFPVGTFAVNILGGFLMGLWIAAITVLLPAKARDLHLLFAIGVLGGFTTFSAFSLDIFLLVERGLLLQAALYIVGSVTLSVLALLGGIWIIKLTMG